jgi:hypothetical protein
VLPERFSAQNINDVIPVGIQSELALYMPVYTGNNPPDIAGTYLMSPTELLYSSDSDYPAGHIFDDFLMQFENQVSENVVTYRGKHIEAQGFEMSSRVSVAGSGDNFSAYFRTTGETNNIRTETALIITGTKTFMGIEDLYYAFIMLDKGPDPDGYVMDVNEFRIIKDGDNLSGNTFWINSSNKNNSVLFEKSMFDSKL